MKRKALYLVTFKQQSGNNANPLFQNDGEMSFHLTSSYENQLFLLPILLVVLLLLTTEFSIIMCHSSKFFYLTVQEPGNTPRKTNQAGWSGQNASDLFS
jgi:hypothetical protein